MKHWILLVTIAAAAAGACSRSPEKRPEAKPQTAGEPDTAEHKDQPNVVTVDPGMQRDLRITTTRVEGRTGAEEVLLLGELGVDQREYAEVAVPVSARVTRLLVGEGDHVRSNQALAELSSPELGRARADFLTAQARLTLARSVLDRRRGLAEEKIVPLREVQEAEAAHAEAEASLRSARAAISAFGVPPPAGELDTHAASAFQLRSPVTGAVIERTAVMGQMLAPDTPAFRIGNLDRLWLIVHAFERDAVRVAAGSQARLSFPALPGRTFTGTISVIGRQVESASRTVPVRIDVRNEDRVLRPGMSATAAVQVGTSDTQLLAVPVAAVQRVRSEWCVFVPKDNGTFDIRVIGRGRDLGDEVEVLSGLKAGETVVVDGAFLLKAQAEKSQGGHDDH